MVEEVVFWFSIAEPNLTELNHRGSLVKWYSVKNVQWPAQIQLGVKSGNGCNWASARLLSLSRGIDVFGLGQAGQLILVAWQAAEEDGAADGEDGGAPAEAVGPGVGVVALEYQVVEFDGVEDQSDGLENHCRERERGEKGL